MRAKTLAAILAVAALPVAAQQPAKPPPAGSDAFIYRCLGNSRILPTGLAMGKVEWKFEIQPSAKRVVAEDGKSAAIEIDQYRISFPLEGNHWISITRSNGHFNAVQPIQNPDRKMPEYLLYSGECKRGA